MKTKVLPSDPRQNSSSKPKTTRKFINGGIRIAALASSAALCMGLLGCGNPIDSVTNYLMNEQYDSALEAFKSVKITDSNRTEVLGKLSAVMTSTVEQYAADQISYDRASSTLETINSMHVSGLDSDLAVAYSQVTGLKRSKQSYNDGMQYFQNGDYLNAYYCFNQVIESDCNYESATAKATESINQYQNSIIASARAYADAHDYDQAVEVLQYALYDHPEFTAFQDEIDSLLEEKEAYLISLAKEEAISQAEAFAGDNNFEEALGALNEFKEAYTDQDEEVNALYDEYTGNYVSFILEKATTLRDNQQYLQALEMLNNASQVVASDDFAQLIAEINAIKPTYLCEVKCQNSERFDLLEAGNTVTDVIGNVYNPGNLYIISSEHESWGGGGGGYAEYYLGYKYNTLEGLVAVGDNSVNETCTLTIEGDGVILETVELSRLTVPVPVSIDVSTVNVLKISLSIPGGDTFYAILSDFHFSM